MTGAWVGRNAFTLNLPPKWLRLDPTDVINVALPDATLALRLTQVDFGGNNIVACKAVAEDEIAYTSSAKGTGAALSATIIPIATPISAFMLDLPMLCAEDDGLGLYYAFGLRDGGSASLYRSQDALAWSIIATAGALGRKRSGRTTQPLVMGRNEQSSDRLKPRNPRQQDGARNPELEQCRGSWRRGRSMARCDASGREPL